MRLSGVRIATSEIEAATDHYTTLLSVEPVATAGGGRRYQLARGAVELVVGRPEETSVLFARDDPDERWPAAVTGFHELPIGADDGVVASGRHLAPDAVEAIDHVVVFTPSPARTIELWRDRVGMRLAFDREFPERKVRLLFFRSGGLTFEFATALPASDDAAGPDRFYGVSYRVPNLAARRAALIAAGFDVSEIRPGNKAGTRVASVRSQTAGVPTILLEADVPRGSAA